MGFIAQANPTWRGFADKACPKLTLPVFIRHLCSIFLRGEM